MKTSRNLTREERRRIQRLRANLIGIGMILALVVAGFILGISWA